jgi:hypothetical protein
MKKSVLAMRPAPCRDQGARRLLCSCKATLAGAQSWANAAGLVSE